MTVELAPGKSRVVSLRRTGEAGVERSAAGPARIVYVHGTPGDANAWNSFLREPVMGCESIALDRPGFGKTGGRAVPSFAEQAAAFAPLLLDPAGDDRRPTVLVGHSLGGPIVAAAAALWPEKVAGIVIVAGSLDPALEAPEWYNEVLAWPVVSWIAPRELTNSNEEIFGAVDETRWLSMRLDQVRCPVTVVHGEDDDLVPVENVAFMRRAFVNAKGVRAVVLEGENHFIPWTAEGVLREEIGRMVALVAGLPVPTPKTGGAPGVPTGAGR
jgi:pimeloyl-ACP methyl ester carboxylesterase